MNKVIRILMSIVAVISANTVWGQCSICTKTATQLGEDAARGLNGGIIYLATAPFLIVGYIGYRWWQTNRH